MSPNETPLGADPRILLRTQPLADLPGSLSGYSLLICKVRGWHHQLLIANCPQGGSKGIWPAKSWETTPSKEGPTVLSQSWHSHNGTRKERPQQRTCPACQVTDPHESSERDFMVLEGLSLWVRVPFLD